MRFSINTGRAEIVQRLNKQDTNADAMDWSNLRERVASGSVDEKQEAVRILNRRAALSLAPLVFSLLGAILGLRIRRGGKSVGVLLTIIVVIIYYLLSLLGESFARAGYDLTLCWTMARHDLHSRFELVVSVRQSSAFFILRLDPVTRTKRIGASGKSCEDKESRPFGSGFSKPDGCDAFSLTRAQFPCLFRCARSHLQHLHVVRALALHRRQPSRRGTRSEISFVSTTTDHSRALSCNDADLGARDLRIACTEDTKQSRGGLRARVFTA